MDKRTIIYIILVSVVFFGLNLYFGKQRSAQEQEIQASRAKKTAEQQVLVERELEQRLVDIGALPLVSLDETHYGVQLGDAMITLSWTTSMPTSLTAKGQTYQLKSDNPTIDSPMLYTNEQFKRLSLPHLSQSQDLQLLYFSNEGPRLALGEYDEGSVRVIGPRPTSNALALTKEGDSWMVAGLYENTSKLFVPMQNLPVFAPYIQLTQTSSSTPVDQTQKYYVLENETLQLVFSNVGGALSEINLPLRSASDKQSVVNEIEIDREIAEDFPLNARFPLFAYYRPGNSEAVEPEGVGGYYPLMRRTLETSKGLEQLSPEYYALNVVSDYPEMAQLVYTVEKFTDDTIVFVGSQPHRKITKTFTLSKETPYLFDVSVKVDGDARGLSLSSGIPEVEMMSNSSTPTVQYRFMRKGKQEMQKISLPKPKESVSSSTVNPEWIVNSNGYLGLIMNPTTPLDGGYKVFSIPGVNVPTRLTLVNSKEYPASKYPGYLALLPLPQKNGTSQLRVYSGPFEEKTLKTVDKMVFKETGVNPGFTNARSFHGWFSFISKPFAKLLFVVMQFFYMITHSWGVAIILLTVFLRVCLYPLNAWSFKSMRRMQKLAPQIKAIQKKNKKDPKKAQMEIMMLYREKKVNPLMGCLPILIQLPFLVAMFDLLKSSFQLRGATFIPGWIDNLTAPDELFCWGTPIFFFGTCFHLLPFLLGGVMFLQQRISAGMKKDVKEMTDQERQQKAMGTIMTVVFTVMFYNFPSGLNIYWLSSMSLGILQQWLTNKWLDRQDAKPQVIVSSKKK